MDTNTKKVNIGQFYYPFLVFKQDYSSKQSKHKAQWSVLLNSDILFAEHERFTSFVDTCASNKVCYFVFKRIIVLEFLQTSC